MYRHYRKKLNILRIVIWVLKRRDFYDDAIETITEFLFIRLEMGQFERRTSQTCRSRPRQKLALGTIFETKPPLDKTKRQTQFAAHTLTSSWLS